MCVRFPSGDWRCNLGVGGANNSQYGPPPGNASGSSNAQATPSNNAQAYYEQAGLKIGKKDHQGAIADMNRAIQIEPNNAEFYWQRGKAKFWLKDRSGAIKDFERVAKLNKQQGNTDLYEFALKMIENVKKYKY